MFGENALYLVEEVFITDTETSPVILEIHVLLETHACLVQLETLVHLVWLAHVPLVS